MTETRPIEVLVTLDFPPEFLEAVRAAAPGIVLHHHPVPAEGPVGLDAVPADLLARAEVMYASSLLPGPDSAPRLRWLQLDTSGIDHVRGTELWESDCTITTLGGVSPAPLAEWIIMMVLAEAHHLRRTEDLARDSIWPTREERWQGLMPRNLRSSTLTVVGYGRIGHEVARLARALGMTVQAVRRGARPTGDTRFGDTPEVEGVIEVPASDLTEALSTSDYVVLTVPLTDQTAGLFGPETLATLKHGAVLINGSRGGVVDEAALLPLLDSGAVSLYASDVFEDEPLPVGHPFWLHPRVVVTPHVAGFAPDYGEAVTRLFTENLRRYAEGRSLLNVADRGRGY